jgi:hypothetical protein
LAFSWKKRLWKKNNLLAQIDCFAGQFSGRKCSKKLWLCKSNFFLFCGKDLKVRENKIFWQGYCFSW